MAHHLLSPNDNENHLLSKLQGLVTNIKWSPEDVAKLFDALLKRFESTTKDRKLLSWMLELLHTIEINYITPTWRSQTEGLRRSLIQMVQDERVTDEDLKECLEKDEDKTLDEILDEIRQQELNQVDEKILEEVRDIVSSVVQSLESGGDGSQLRGLKRDLLRLCRAAEKTMKYRPRLTQMVSWCIMALSKSGRLIQVGTGEGKSCIVAMFAAFRAIKGEKVDIMSSSTVLAQRDAEEWKVFYDFLKVTVSCNTNKTGRDLKMCYESQVVYGTVEEFAGDWLRHHFQREDIFGQRKFQCAIVDEVDSLMLDKGNHVVYISSDTPALQHLNPLLALIWATVNQYSKISAVSTVGRKYQFHQVVLENITKHKDVDEFTILQMAEDSGLLTRGSVRTVRRNPSLLTEKTASVSVNQLAEFFKTTERKFPSCQFVLHCINKDGVIEEVNKELQTGSGKKKQRVSLLLFTGGFCQYMYHDQESVSRAVEAEIKRDLCFTPCEPNKDKSKCYIPGFLSDLVTSNLKVWIENAFAARTMTQDHQYVMEKHGIVPVDYSCTGVVENFMKWQDGLQQFVEMKHQSKLSDMTAITNYMSNVGMIQKYGNQIYGVSGTLGQQAETETLQKIYEGIKTCQIPSFKRRKLFEVEGVIFMDEKEWMEKVCDVVIAQTRKNSFRDERAVLIICETISRAKVLHRALGDKVPKKKLYISNNMDNTAIVTKALNAGDVIIATNLAGRGTDLKVSDAVKKAGGLFVVQTFLPLNARVEAQAFGRTARQGSPGSAQLIICSSHLPEPLKLLVSLRELQSLLENIVDVAPLIQNLFVMQLKMYQKSHNNQGSKVMSELLSKILTKNSQSGMILAKKMRDDSVAERLARYLEHDIPDMKKKQELFSQYLEILDDVYKSSNNKPADAHLSALNEFWGMWLLRKFNKNDSIIVLQDRLSRDMDTARKSLEQRESPLSNLHHYTAFGNELREQKKFEESIKLYTKAIEEDRCWAAIAFYNRAFASLTLQNGKQDPRCITQALEDLQNALKSIELYCEQTKLTFSYSTQQSGSLHSDSVTRFDKHIISRWTVLHYFKKNISEAIEKVDRADDLRGTVKVEERLVFFLVPLVFYLPMMAISMESVRLIRSRDLLGIQQLINQPSFDILNELRCLESLGLTHVYVLDTQFSVGGFFSKIHRLASRVFD